MPVFATTGSDHATQLSTSQRLGLVKRLLEHRGETEIKGSVGGQNTIADASVSMAWSGTIRCEPSKLLVDFNQKGIDFLNDLDGEFAIVISTNDALYVARDPAGARTAYYGQHNGNWYVAAEPKGIWGLPGFSRRIRRGAIAQYLTYSYIPGSDTMLEGIQEVLPGHWVCLQDGCDPKVVRYFQYPEYRRDENERIDFRYWSDKFQTLLSKEVALRLSPLSSPTLFLSGGLDSSIVAAELAKQSSSPVRTFSVHFGDQYPNELSYAHEVVDRLKTDHEDVEISANLAVRNLRELVWRLDEPIGDPVTMPNYELAKIVASRGVTEVFNGEGGDPLFGGPKNMSMLLGHWYGSNDTAPLYRERRYLASYRRAYSELHRVLSPDLLADFDEESQLCAPLTPYFQQDGPLLHKLLAINTQLKGAHLILPKVERMLAASNVQPLSPLFTKSMIDLAFSSPPKAKLFRGVEKWLMKEAFRGHIPDSIIQRPKSGMRVPVHYWFKGNLKRYAKGILKKRTLREAGLFNPDRVQQWLRYDTEQTSGRYGLRIWMLLTFEIWRRIVIEGESP